MAGPAKGLVLTGARARLSLDGVEMWYATNVSYSEEVEQFPVEVLDQYEVAEHVAMAYRVTFSAQLLRLVNQPLKNRQGVAVFPRLEDLMDQKEMTAVIEDRKTGAAIATVQGVKASRHSSTVAVRQGVFSDVEFVGIRIQDESEIK